MPSRFCLRPSPFLRVPNHHQNNGSPFQSSIYPITTNQTRHDLQSIESRSRRTKKNTRGSHALHHPPGGLRDKADHSGIRPLARKIRHAGFKRLILMLYQDTSRRQKRRLKRRVPSVIASKIHGKDLTQSCFFKNKYEAKLS